MTLSEFKAWMEGFVEALPADGAPTAQQFAKVTAKLATVHGDTFTLQPNQPAPVPSPLPWPTALPPFTFAPLTGDPLPVPGYVICGIDWSADHLADWRAQGRLEAAA